MNTRSTLVRAALLMAAVGPSSGQVVEPAGGSVNSGGQGAGSIRDFSGVWVKPNLGLEPPLSGPVPVTNKSRGRQTLDVDGRPLPSAAAPLVSTAAKMVGDYTNPILNPQAAEVVKKRGEMELSGMPFPSARNQCWPEGVPAVLSNQGIRIFQQPDKITILYPYDHQVRRVRMNQPHPAQVTPSWYGDSVAHYEGDTLVIDTVGVKTGPLAMVDWFGTPFTHALHVVERYQLIDYEAAREAQIRGLKEWFRLPGDGGDSGLTMDPDYKGKGLQIQFTVEDEGVFTMPWSAIVTYRRGLEFWPEWVCAENLHATYLSKDSAVPRAEKPDF